MSEPSLTIRASSFAGLFDCAYMWEGIYLLGMRNTVGMKAVLGTAIHAGTAAFDTARLNGDDIKPDDAVGVMIDKLHSPDNDFDQSKDDLSIRDASNIGVKLTAKYCTEVSPNYNFSAVEMETKPLVISCDDDITIQLTGTLDRARVLTDGASTSIVDLKTGYSAVQNGVAVTKFHAPQIGVYELLLEHSTGLSVSEESLIIGMSTSGSSQIATGKIKNAKRVIVGDENNKGLLEYAAKFFKEGLFPPNPSSRLCGPKFCPRWSTCHFRER